MKPGSVTRLQPQSGCFTDSYDLRSQRHNQVAVPIGKAAFWYFVIMHQPQAMQLMH